MAWLPYLLTLALWLAPTPAWAGEPWHRSFFRYCETGLRSLIRPAVTSVKYAHIDDTKLEYLSWWREQINPKNGDLKILNGAIGPDLTTPLVGLNATDITGIDTHPFDAARLRSLLSQWDQLGQPGLSPADASYLKLKYPDSGLSQSELEKGDFLKALELRKNRGYWDNSFLAAWGHERLLMYELKSLGVDPATIRISGDPGSVEINFLWGDQNLGIPPKNRVVRFVCQDIDDFFAAPRKPQSANRFDVYLQKSVPTPTASDRTVIANLPPWLTDSGVILYSPDHFHTESERKNRAAKLASETGFEILPSNPSLEARIARQTLRADRIFKRGSTTGNPPSDWRYGWQLSGLRRRPQ